MRVIVEKVKATSYPQFVHELIPAKTSLPWPVADSIIATAPNRWIKTKMNFPTS